ncbi:MAG: hypothetical protein IPF79_04585 [Ignavibacteria bacterium]|nr:hypothetical protein [Ignavibacteria bacterium]
MAYSYKVATWRNGAWEFRDGLHTQKVYFGATDRILGRTSAGAGMGEEITCTAFARTLLDDANAASARATLGLAVAGETLLVHTSFSGLSAPYYNSITSALNAAVAGTNTTIIVYAGTYDEKITMKNKVNIVFMDGATIKPTTANPRHGSPYRRAHVAVSQVVSSSTPHHTRQRRS